MRWSSDPDPSFAAAAWIASIGLAQIPREQHAHRDRDEEEYDQQPRSPPDRRLDGCERLAQRLLHEDPPARRVHPLERAQHLGPLRISSVGDDALGRRVAGDCGADLRQRTEVRIGQDEAVVRGVGDDPTAGINCVGVAGRADLRATDRVDDRPKVDVGNDDAAARRSLGHRHVQVRPAVWPEGDRAEKPLLGPRAPELVRAGAVAHAGDAVGLVDLV